MGGSKPSPHLVREKGDEWGLGRPPGRGGGEGMLVLLEHEVGACRTGLSPQLTSPILAV